MATPGGTFGDDPDAEVLDDGGPSVHVFGVDEGLEHRRFDCFAAYPHYHCIRALEHENRIVGIDDVAVGEAIAWTIERHSQFAQPVGWTTTG